MLAGLGCALLVAATLAAYWNSTSGVFLLDDKPNIVNNLSIRELFPISKHLLQGNLRRLPNLSFALNYHLGGLSPTGYHWFNIAVHALAGCFLFLLLRTLFRSHAFSESFAHNSSRLAFCVALLWAVHPLNTQAVSYIVQRSESMMGLALFAFLLLVAVSASSSRPAFWLLAAFFVFCLGLLCKEVMVMSLPMAILMDRAFLSNSWRDALARRGWFWGMCVLPLGVALVVIVPTMLDADAAVGFELKSVTPLQYASTQPAVILHYLRLVIWPSPLVFDYGWLPEDRMWVVLSTATVLFLSVACLAWFFRSRAQWAFWGISALLALAPTSSVMPLQDIAVEHRMYVSTAFVLVPLVALVFWLSTSVFKDNPTTMATGICAAIAFGFGWMTVDRNIAYHSPITMWQDVISKTTGLDRDNLLAARAYSNLGEAYGDLELWDESVESLEEALKQGGFGSRVHGNLARAYVATNQPEKAAAHVLEALKFDPESARLRQQAGLVAAMVEDYAEAERQFRAARQLDARDPVLMVNLAQTLVAQRKTDEAAELLRSAIETDDSLAEARDRLIRLLIGRSQFAEAESVAAQFVKDFPENSAADYLLGIVFASTGRLDEAAKHWEQAASGSNPPADVNFQLGNYHRSRGNLPLAGRYYEREVENNPAHLDALNNLAGITAGSNPTLAISYFERVIKLAPDYLQAHYNIAALQASQGQSALAIGRLEKLLEKKPDFAPAKQLLQSLQTTVPDQAPGS